MIEKKNRRISEIPAEQLELSLNNYANKHMTSVRSARKYLRSIGMQISDKGMLMNPSL